MNAWSALSQRWAPVRARWKAMPLRERRLVGGTAAFVGLALLWLVAVQPAWRTVRSAPTELAALDAQWQRMQRQAAEARSLKAAPAVPPGNAALALQGATQRLGDAGRLSLQGDRAILTLTDAEGEALQQWLAEARSGARARPLEAKLTRGPDGFSGTLVVSIGGRS